MASISTCFTITHNSHPKPSSIFRPKFHTSQKHHSINNTRSFVSSNVSPVVAKAMIRPEGIIESDKLSVDVRKRAMDAIDDRGRRVTVGDVASAVGIKLSEAHKVLEAMVADTNGFLEVSKDGDIFYVFSDDYRSKLASKSLCLKTEPYIEQAKVDVEYLVKATFGALLIASILIIFTTITVMLTSSRVVVKVLYKMVNMIKSSREKVMLTIIAFMHV